ncbi:hypothetical protein DYB28_015636 [Aphanomyces astaci]|uniref:Uncharacterized protein n=1 Tax=Aphanomyces astaci TaxID=112090 RepID=A0A9X8DR01_APHAT|nr:hypothetical protein DYB28_015636 [Aphanomyces astaci]
MVRYLHDHRSEGCSKRAVVVAAKCGHLEVERFLHTQYPFTHSLGHALTSAASNNRLDVATYIIHALGSATEDFSTDPMDAAARKGHLDMIQLLHQHHFGCTTQAMDGAALYGHVEVVQWLHTHRTEGCTTLAMDRAARYGHLEFVKWLYANRGDAQMALEGARKKKRYDVVAMLKSIIGKA